MNRTERPITAAELTRYHAMVTLDAIAARQPKRWQQSTADEAAGIVRDLHGRRYRSVHAGSRIGYDPNNPQRGATRVLDELHRDYIDTVDHVLDDRSVCRTCREWDLAGVWRPATDSPPWVDPLDLGRLGIERRPPAVPVTRAELRRLTRGASDLVTRRDLADYAASVALDTLRTEAHR